MANFGIGLGSFLSGVASGANAMGNIQNMQSQKTLRDLQTKEIQQQQADKTALRDINQQGAADAQANTDGQLDNVMAYYMKNTAPKIVQHYLSTGDPQTANVYKTWIADANVQQGAKYGVGMMRAAAMQDLDGVGKYMVQAYNQPGYFEDGNTATGYQVVRDSKGNPTGLEIGLKNADGTESTHTFDSIDDIYKVAQTFGNPLEVFKTGMANYQQQQQQAQKIQAEQAKEQRAYGRDISKMGIQNSYQTQRDNNASNLRRAENKEKSALGLTSGQSPVAKADAQAAALKEKAGYTDEQIKKIYPRLLGIVRQSKPRADAITDLMKDLSTTDPAFAKLKTAEERMEYAGRVLDLAQSYDETPTGAAGQGLPAYGSQNGQTTNGQGVPIYIKDGKTGQIIQR